MDDVRIPSINVSDINMDLCFFNPGCAQSIYKPESGIKMLKLLQANFGTFTLHEVCCRHDPRLPRGSTIINNCAGCDRRFRSQYDGIQTISLWEILDGIASLPLPDHSGLAVSVQDSCSYRPKPQVHAAVRRILRKMNIEIIDAALSGTRSVCCGDDFYPQLPIEQVTELQKGRAAQMPCQDDVVYFVSFIKSMAFGRDTPL